MNTTPSSAAIAIEQLFANKGALQYGETVNQIQHALQCAMLAEQAGSSDELIVAAMLHDVGHMIHRDAANALVQGQDDAHERLGAKYLAKWFGAGVCEPIALHVQAKRFLCKREPDYHSALSPMSQRTLELQGGPMSEDEAAAFEKNEHAMHAVQVRRWDDFGKEVELATPPLGHFMSIVGRCIVRH